MKDRTKKPFLSRFVAGLMAFLLLFTGLIPSSGSVSFADTPDPEEQMCRVRILDTEGGDLSFVHTTEKEIRLRKGDSVTVSVSPKEGYTADTLSYMVGSDMDEENVKEVPFVNGLADVPITDDTVITTSFYKKPVDSVVKTMPEDVTGSLYTKSEVDAIAKGEEKTSSIKATEFYTKQPGKTPEGVVYEAVDTTDAKDVLVAPDGVYKGKPQEPASRPNGPMLRSAPVANWYDGTYTFTHMPGSSWTPLMTVTSDGDANPDFDTRLRWMFSDANRMPILGNHTSRASITNGHFSFCQNPFFKSPPSGGSYPRLISITSGSSITSESDFDKFIHLSAQYRFPGIYSTTKYSEYNNLPTNEFYYGKRCVEDDSWQLRQATKIMLLWMMLVNTAQRDPALAQRIIDAAGKTQYISLDTLRDYDKIISLSWYYCADIYVLRNCGGSFRIYPITYEECSAVADIANYIAIHLNDGKFKLHNMQYNMFTAPLDGSGSQYDHHDTTNSEQQTHGQVLGWIEMQENGKLNLQKSSKTPLISSNNSCYSLAGARYRVYDKNNSAVGTLTTTTSGKTNTLSLPVGTYTVKEISPSKGFEKNPTSSTVTIRSNQTTTLSTGAAIETPLDDPVALRVRKIVEGNYRGSLAGIRFRLSHYAGYYTSAAEAEASGDPTCSAIFATNEKGYIDASIHSPVSGIWKYKDKVGNNTAPLGTLVWEEVDTLPELLGLPKQYAVKQIYDAGGTVGERRYEKFAAPINQGGSEQKLNNDYKRANVCVYKFDQDFNASRPQGDGTLAGVTYRITRKGASDGFPAEGIEITTAWDSSRNAYVAKTKDDTHGESTGGPLVYGSYVIEEIDPSTGYANGNFHEEFTFGENGDISKNGDWMEFNDVKGKASRNAIHRGGVKFPKISVDTNDNQEGDINFSGIQFAFINRSKNNVFVEGREYKIGEVVAIRETNAEGILETENNLFPYGTYDVVELRRDSGVQVGSMYSSANKGKSPYASPNEDSVLWKENKKTFIIRQPNVVVDGEKMVNEPSRGDGALQKKDIELGFAQGDSSFAGIQYALVNASAYKSLYKGTLYAPGKVMDILTADAEGKVKSDKMPFGTYTVHELRSDHKVSIGNTFDGSDFGTSIYANNNGYLYKEFTDTKSIRTNGEVIEFTNANPVVRGGMSLDKIITDTKDNQEGDINLSGIRYAIVNASEGSVVVNKKEQAVGNVVAIFATDEHGAFTTDAKLLPYGTYKVYELKRDSKVEVGNVWKDANKGESIYASPKEDSVLWAENEKTIVIREQEKIVDVRDANDPVVNKAATGFAEIQKTDTQTTTKQGDATFEGITYALVNTSTYKVLYKGTLYKPGEIIDLLKVDALGKAKSDALVFGTYDLHELRQDHTAQIGKVWDNAMLGKSIYANEKGYLYNEFIDTKSITKQDDLVTFTNANDVVRGGVVIEKFDRETKQATPLGQATFSGVTFTITNKSDEAVVVNGKTYKPGEVVMSATTETVTDKNGMVRSIAKTAPDALPYGHYEIREKVSSVGYLMDEESSNFVREFSIGYQREGYQFFTKEHKDILDLFGDGKGLGNQIIREDFHFIKKDEDTMERMGRIVFLMTSKTTGESHILVTDENGEFNSSAWQTNETAGILHSENTNVNDPDSPITNGAIVKDANGNYKVVKPELLNQKSGVWFTGLAPDKVKWTKDGKSYDVNGVTVPVRDDLRAFPYDTYEIKELRSKDNEGYKLITATVTLHEYGDHKGRGIDIDYGTLDNKPIYVATKLLSKTTNDHVAPISKSENFVDTLSFMNLTPKKEYKTIAELRIVDENGKDAGQAARVEKTFTPKMPNGEVEVAFDHVDLSKLVGGMKLVAIQTIYDADGVVISHADLTDEDQTVSLISIGTKAKGDVEQEANATNEKTTIVDTISYKGLPVGKEYTLRAELHYQEVKEDGTIVDGGIVKDANGKDVTQTATFTPKEANGETEMTFTFATPKDLGGKNVVAFEYLEKDKVLYATHADITDEAQTVHFPKVGTTLVDAEDGDKVIEAVEEAKVVDTVKVENLTIGKEYTVDGKLHIKELGKDGKAIDKGIAKDKDGKESYAKTTFVAEKTTEMVKLTFTVDGRELAGKSLVAFENLYRNGVLLGSEADIENADQTVDIMKMGTTLTDMATKSHTVSRAEISKDGKTMTVNLIDHIVYENVPLGKEIVAKGKLMVPDGKDVEKATALLDENAKEIVGETRFTPSERNGEVEVHFTFTLPVDTDITKLVAFETFEQEITDSEGKTKTVVIGCHEDLHDEAQTVSLMDIKTTLTGADKKAKEVKADSKVELIDTVDYTNAVVGEEYTITGEMHRKGMKDGKVVDLGVLTNADGKPVTATTTFVAKEASGTVALSFMVDTSKMKDGEELVAFEKATQKGDGKTEGGIVVAKHEDITDASQTVVVKKASTTPNTVTDVTLETAVHTFAVPVATLLALSMIGLSVLALYRKRKEDAE